MRQCFKMQPLPAHPGAVEGVRDEEEGEQEDGEAGHLAPHRVRAVRLLALVARPKQIQVSHEDAQQSRHCNA